MPAVSTATSFHLYDGAHFTIDAVSCSRPTLDLRDEHGCAVAYIHLGHEHLLQLQDALTAYFTVKLPDLAEAA